MLGASWLWLFTDGIVNSVRPTTLSSLSCPGGDGMGLGRGGGGGAGGDGGAAGDAAEPRGRRPGPFLCQRLGQRPRTMAASPSPRADLRWQPPIAASRPGPGLRGRRPGLGGGDPEPGLQHPAAAAPPLRGRRRQPGRRLAAGSQPPSGPRCRSPVLSGSQEGNEWIWWKVDAEGVMGKIKFLNRAPAFPKYDYVRFTAADGWKTVSASSPRQGSGERFS